MFRIITSSTREYEKYFAIHHVLSNRLGLDFDMVFEQQNPESTGAVFRIEYENRALLVADCFFNNADTHWLKPSSLPGTHARWCSAEDLGVPASREGSSNSFPALYVDQALQRNEAAPHVHHFALDIFGSVFFMLTRYEELLGSTKDGHGRFTLKDSISYKWGIVERAFIDEYIELFWQKLISIWPGLTRTKSEYRVTLTHDVDWPFATHQRPLSTAAKEIARSLLKERNLTEASRKLLAYTVPSKWGAAFDINNTFDHIMDISESKGVHSEFYFMAMHTHPYDTHYKISSSSVTRVLKQIDNRNHIIGLHPSYNSLGNPAQLKTEKNVLENQLSKLGIQQPVTSGRQHYLRWDSSRSWDDWSEAGLRYDSTLGYAEAIGFRAGTCHPYYAWSWKNRKALTLIERPLVLMEATCFRPEYMGLSAELAQEKIRKVNNHIKKLNGEFVVLWHNCSLNSYALGYESAVNLLFEN